MLATTARQKTSAGGFALVEVVIAACLLGLVAVGSIQALGALNAHAVSNRVVTNARAIVQRNIDQALSVTCGKNSVPGILAITPAAGTVYDDDAGTTNVVTVVLQGTSDVQLVQGTLTRIVTAITNADNADIRNVTFRLNYTVRKRNYACALSTIRAIDD